MNKAILYKFAAVVVTVVLPSTVAFAGQIPSRISGSIHDNEVVRLAGNTKPTLASAQDSGPMDSSQPLPEMAVHFTMSSQEQGDLEQLLRQQQTPGSAEYHHFLTPEEFGARFGPNSDDLAKVSSWLAAQGFSDIEPARSRTFIQFSGTVAQASSAFHTNIHRYLVDGESHFANSTDPEIPKALDGLLQSIGGLNDFRPTPRAIRRPQPNFTSSISGNHFLTPGDLAVINNIQPLYQSGLDGSGVKIAVVGQSDILLSDIRAFRAAAGLPAKDPTIVLVGTDPGRKSGDETESDLDIEWAGAIAPNATVLFVTATDVSTSIRYVIDQNLASVLSISYGLCEAAVSRAQSRTDAAQYAQANAQGITVVAASGDSGAAGCDTSYPARQGISVDLPAAYPNVTGVGGTRFNEGSGSYWNSSNSGSGASALSYIPEVAWNDSSASAGLSSGGGGASVYMSKPSWQTGTGVPNDGARDVPDIALPASPNHDGYLICSSGNCVNGFRNTDSSLFVIGGTSCGAPVFAGIAALLVQSQGPQGNVNPNLYTLARRTSDVFHDVIAGNNIVTCRVNSRSCTSGSFGYSAGPGYDQVTGLGSVDAYHLITEWIGPTATAATANSNALYFVPITPCRVVDTRSGTGTFGGPELDAATIRDFAIPSGACNVPATALAYALNVTVVPSVPLGYLTLWPSGQARPLVSTLNSDGRIKANAAIVPAGTDGGVSVFATNPTHLILDVTGYFVPATSSSGLQFYPVAPCRVADTRSSSGSLGGPYVTGGQMRNFPVLASSCGVPATAQAYSLNFTAVPRQPLEYMTAWPAGQAQPLASILNAPTGTVTANSAILPAGNTGAISVLASNDADLVIDVNGYFAPPTAGGTSFYTVAPCRVLDTRNPSGAQPFSGTIAVDVPAGGCQAPASAQAFVLNATVVPSTSLQYLTLWQGGAVMPIASTLNADPGTVTSNLAVVPAANGLVSAFATDPTYLVLDISGYFAP